MVIVPSPVGGLRRLPTSLWSQLRLRISSALLDACCDSGLGLRANGLGGFTKVDKAEMEAGKSLLTFPNRFGGTLRPRSSSKTRVRSRESPSPTVEKCDGLLNKISEGTCWDNGELRARE